MKRIDSKLRETANIIDAKLAKSTNENREEISTDILSHIRNFCEVVMFKIYNEENNVDIYQTHDNLKKVRKFIKIRHYDIYKFHTMLDASVGHMDFGKNQSEALMLKYIPKLIDLKKLLMERYEISVFENINKYPLDLDSSLFSFYEKILVVLLENRNTKKELSRNQYFVRKRSMKYINGYIFYEYVFDVSDDKVSKFNTFVCYSLKHIRFDYDLKFILSKKEITFLNTKININIIDDYEYSIRPCTFKNILYLINYNAVDGKRDKDYKIIMQKIKQHNVSLLDVIDNDFDIGLSSNGYYTDFINAVKSFLSKNSFGKNIIRYLLLEMRNSVIKAQAYYPKIGMDDSNDNFNNLRIRTATKSFELMPFAFNPKEAKPSLYTLLYLYNGYNHKDEIVYRNVSEYINKNNTLFVKPEDIGYSEETFEKRINEFNSKLENINPYYLDESIVKVSNYYTIKSYYKKTLSLIILCKSRCKKTNMIVEHDYLGNSYLNKKQIDILTKIFEKSQIELLTGSAGTGKTTLIKEFIKNNWYKSILCLTTTNTANNNIKINDNNLNVTYKNIAQFEKEKHFKFYDIVIIDEASFVSTNSFYNILLTFKSSLLLVVGDPNQLESIDFGNWFLLLLSFLSPFGVVHTLDDELRTKVKELSDLWKAVNTGEKNNILELLSSFDMTSKLCDDVFQTNDSEVVLCLNYDGLYGINNINRYLQASNKNTAYEYQQNLYKVNDPVVFITNDYNSYGIYNNLKGKIIQIIENDEKITFKIELYNTNIHTGKISNELVIKNNDSKCYAIVSKNKYYTEKYDTDMDIRTKLPFQISYAMSIHKAQGLEFDSVKIVITKETDELINKNIFYTAITRAKNKLKIYWEPEVANFVLDNIEKESNAKKIDLSLLSEKINSISS